MKHVHLSLPVLERVALAARDVATIGDSVYRVALRATGIRDESPADAPTDAEYERRLAQRVRLDAAQLAALVSRGQPHMSPISIASRVSALYRLAGRAHAMAIRECNEQVPPAWEVRQRKLLHAVKQSAAAVGATEVHFDDVRGYYTKLVFPPAAPGERPPSNELGGQFGVCDLVFTAEE